MLATHADRTLDPEQWCDLDDAADRDRCQQYQRIYREGFVLIYSARTGRKPGAAAIRC
jgi:hypothetical protein